MKKILRVLLLVILVAVLVFVVGRIIDRYFTKPASVTVNEPENVKQEVNPGKKEVSQLEFVAGKLAEEFKTDYGNVPELSFYIKDLKTGADVVFNDRQMNSASVIKLFIALTAYEQDGMAMDEETKEWLNKMITESHNESSNNLIDKYTFGRINQVIYKNGYRNTELRRKMYNTLPPGGPSGEDNLTSAKEVGLLLEKVYNGSFVNKECSDDLLNYLKNQKRVNKIPAKLKNKNVTVYNKTGELSSVENDVAIITGKNEKGEEFQFIFCVFVNDIPNNETRDRMKEDIQESIADMALELVTYFENPGEYVSAN